MKKSLLILIPLMLSLGACNTRKESDIPDNPDTPDTPNWGETATKEIVFKGDKTTSSLVQGSKLGDSTFENSVTNFVNAQTNNSLVALGGNDCTIQYVGGDNNTATDISLSIGTGSLKGLIYFTFDLEIVKIEATVQNYYKPHHDYELNVDVTGIDVDAEVVMCSYSPVDGVRESKEVNLATEDAVSIPAESSHSVEFKESTNTIAFYNNAEKHRTYIHSLTITYLVK